MKDCEKRLAPATDKLLANKDTIEKEKEALTLDQNNEFNQKIDAQIALYEKEKSSLLQQISESKELIVTSFGNYDLKNESLAYVSKKAKIANYDEEINELEKNIIDKDNIYYLKLAFAVITAFLASRLLAGSPELIDSFIAFKIFELILGENNTATIFNFILQDVVLTFVAVLLLSGLTVNNTQFQRSKTIRRFGITSLCISICIMFFSAFLFNY